MQVQSSSLCLQTPDDTGALARGLAPILKPGDVLLLSGPVGAGKTHFARQLILARLPAPEDIPSPTYTLVQTYETPATEIWHADLYRLTNPGEIEELGLTDAFETAICLVEWPDRLGTLAPESALSIDFSAPHNDDHRQVTLRWGDPDWGKRLEGLV